MGMLKNCSNTGAGSGGGDAMTGVARRGAGRLAPEGAERLLGCPPFEHHQICTDKQRRLRRRGARSAHIIKQSPIRRTWGRARRSLPVPPLPTRPLSAEIYDRRNAAYISAAVLVVLGVKVHSLVACCVYTGT